MALTQHWPLQGDANNAVSSNDGTLGSGATISAVGPGGSVPNGADFSGDASSYLTLASPVLLSANSDWSIAFWAQQNADDFEGMIFGDTTNDKSFAWLNSVDDFRLRDTVSSTTNYSFVVPAATRLALAHYFLTYTSATNTLSLYVNGTLISSVTFAQNLNITHLGSGYTSHQYNLTGKIADFRIYDSVANSAEIAAVFALGQGGASNSISINSIADDQFFQRPASGNLLLAISGTSSLDEAIEYQVDSGSWATLATASSGTFSGSASAQPGNHTVSVRLSSDTDTTDTVTIHIGDALGYFGQSNPDGRLTNSQTYSGSLGFWIYDENDSWIAGISGYSSPGASGFSPLPLLASQIEAITGLPIAFICQTQGGTGVTSGPWDSNPEGSQYQAAVAAINDSNINGLRAVIFDAGESDILGAEVSLAVVQATLEALHTDIQADTGLAFPLILNQTGETGGTVTNNAAIRGGQQAAIENNAAIHWGALGYDRASLHWETNAEATTYASRIAKAVGEALFGGSDAIPPKIISAVADGTTTVLTTDRDLEAAITYAANAWSHPTATITAASKTGNRQITLTSDIELEEASLLTFGAGSNAAGVEVPRGVGGQPVVPESIVVGATVVVEPGEIPTPKETLSVAIRQRVISIGQE